MGQLNHKCKQYIPRQMNIRKVQLLLLTAIPVLVGSVGFISLNQANAKPVNQIAQASQPSNERPDGQRKRPKIDFAAAATKLGVHAQHN
ncbi:proline/alanine-rich repeat-containing protein [Calothrix sp. NIES-4071]|nr:proline/alanine-rich repeat-containing protein [Calothrix sp. NIES-4071]BAZ60804.1 proline/alanine-rich repeat-containing protein [Calothrix sp. NIES-4105]